MLRRACGLVLVVLGVSLLTAAPAAASSQCQPTPAGWLCTFDADGDGTPERVFVYSDEDPQPVVLDAWRQGSADRVVAGAGAASPEGATAHAVTVRQGGVRADGVSAQERSVRVDSWLPSSIGGWATVTAWDANGNGWPERVHVFAFHSHYGTYAWESGTILP